MVSVVAERAAVGRAAARAATKARLERLQWRGWVRWLGCCDWQGCGGVVVLSSKSGGEGVGARGGGGGEGGGGEGGGEGGHCGSSGCSNKDG